MMFRQEIPSLRLSVEKGTENVPDDGKYYVIVAREIVFKSASKAAALKAYEKHRVVLLEARGGEPVGEPSVDPAEALRREREHYDMQAVRSDSFARRAAKADTRGGRGGRGGV